MIDLRLGDCFDIMPNIADKSIDYSFTSPPYNRKRNDKYAYYKDVNQEWLTMNIQAITSLLRLTKKHVFYNIQANYYNRADVYSLIGKLSNVIVDIHIWEKSNPLPANGKNITNAVEYFLVLGTESLKSNTTYTKNIITTSVNSNMLKEHKAIMKLEVAEYFIDKFTQKNCVVLDPFMGSGTTGVACVNLNRNFIGIELNETYFNIAKKRIQETPINLFGG